jgi:hypothetical protein
MINILQQVVGWSCVLASGLLAGYWYDWALTGHPRWIEEIKRWLKTHT